MSRKAGEGNIYLTSRFFILARQNRTQGLPNLATVKIHRQVVDH